MVTSGKIELHSNWLSKNKSYIFFILLCFVLPPYVGAQTLDVTHTEPSCPTTSTGTVTVGISGGTGPYEYSITDNSSINFSSGSTTDVSYVFPNLPAGDYDITVTDNGSLLPLSNVTLTDPAAFSGFTTSGQNVTCPSMCNGTLTITPTGGTAPYTFNAVATNDVAHNFSDDLSAIGICADEYTITVTDFCGVSQVGSYIVTEQSEYGFSLTGQNWSCATTPGCNGLITVTVTGGTSPYDITLNGTTTYSGVSSPYNITDLCAGDYTVSVTDVNGCPTAGPQSFPITEDINPPTDCDYPSDIAIDLESQYLAQGTFGLLTLVGTPVAPYTYDGNSSGSDNNDSVQYAIDATGYSTVQVKLTAHQSGGSTSWDSNDSLELSFSTDMGNIWTALYADNCRWDGLPDCYGTEQSSKTSTSWIDIPGVSGLNFALMVRCKSGSSDKDYDIDSVLVRGKSIASILLPSYTGSPSSCTDISGVVKLDYPDGYTDGAIHWFCHDPMEFTFTRTWHPEDNCGNVADGKDQKISVGAAPYFNNIPPDDTLDFCHNENVSITGPDSMDVCDGAPVVTWEVTDKSSGVQIGSGTNADFTFTFPQPFSHDTTYTITWIVTDSAGFTNTAAQDVVILKPIQVALSPLDPSDGQFCSGTSASFTITISGGTGSYEDLVLGTTLTPSGTGASWTPLNTNYSSGTYVSGTGVLTTDNPGTSDVITIDVTDADNGGVTGGCHPSSFTFKSGDGVFKVHQNITTGTITRE